MNELDKVNLRFEELGGYIRAIKQKVVRKKSTGKAGAFRSKKHPFLKEQKLVKNWGSKLAKLSDGREKVPKKAKKAVRSKVKKAR